MIESYDVEREDDAQGGRYVIRLDGGADAELTYGRRDPGSIVADHTFVPPSHRGKGLAALLVARLVADARTEGTRIVPVCSYVAAQFRRHPEWADLRAD